MVTIASVPVALPAVLSVTMAVGARQLARRQAVVSHLPAVEELGGIDVLCSDKTGTLTQNRLAVAEPWCAPGVEVDELLGVAALASRAEDRDPIDLAVLDAAQTPARSARPGRTFSRSIRSSNAPGAVVQTAAGNRIRVTKGAPQVVTALCPTGRPSTLRTIRSNGSRPRVPVPGRRPDHGRRHLATARRPALGRPTPRGFGRHGRAARELGVQVKMVTGDQVAIGRQIAREVGIGDHILAADALGDDGDQHSDRQSAMVEQADGFAQVFPQHKYRIVQLLQQRGHIVGMTGDGVNDAPALKQADAGIAVSGSTDAARAAADVVLLAPGLSVIVDAIRRAREIFAG